MAITLFDCIFIFTAILLNVLIILIFLARIKGLERTEHLFGYIVISCIVPLSIVLINYILIGADLWIIIYIIIIISFLIVEMVLDYLLKLDFRTNLKIVVPYTIFYYIAFWGLLAISFVIDLVIGFIVFAVFAVSLIVTIYTHKKDKDKMVKK